MSLLKRELSRTAIVGLTLAVASVAATSAAQPAHATAAVAVPAAATPPVHPHLTSGGVLNPTCIALLGLVGPLFGPFGTVTIGTIGNPAAYAATLQGFLFGNPAGPGLFQVCP
jgi:hypothetical protein